MMTDDLFSGFLEINEFRWNEHENKNQERMLSEEKRAKATALKHQRLEFRRAKSEQHLAQLLPERFEPNTSYHVISHGDVDALSYLIHIVKTTPLTNLTLSTWCMAMPDVLWLIDKSNIGAIENIHFCLGEIFPNQYPAEYDAISRHELTGRCRLTIARNHSKIMLASNKKDEFYVSIESSANVNTNPRIEQTAIHVSRELHDFYAEFFAELKDIDRRRHAVKNG